MRRPQPQPKSRIWWKSFIRSPFLFRISTMLPTANFPLSKNHRTSQDPVIEPMNLTGGIARPSSAPFLQNEILRGKLEIALANKAESHARFSSRNLRRMLFAHLLKEGKIIVVIAQPPHAKSLYFLYEYKGL